MPRPVITSPHRNRTMASRLRRSRPGDCVALARWVTSVRETPSSRNLRRSIGATDTRDGVDFGYRSRGAHRSRLPPLAHLTIWARYSPGEEGASLRAHQASISATPRGSACSTRTPETSLASSATWAPGPWCAAPSLPFAATPRFPPRGWLRPGGWSASVEGYTSGDFWLPGDNRRRRRQNPDLSTLSVDNLVEGLSSEPPRPASRLALFQFDETLDSGITPHISAR